MPSDQSAVSVLIQEVLSDPDLAHDDVFRRLLQAGLQDLIDAEATAQIGAEPYGLLGVFRTVLVLCFRLPSLSPGNRFRPRRECDTLGLSEDEYDCISARSMRQYP